MGAVALLPTGTITFLLSDIEGSTALWERAPEAMRLALSRHDALFETLVGAHHGAHIRPRGEGDSRFAVFQGAGDALAAALAIQRAFATENWPTPRPIAVRIGIHSGQAELRNGDYYGSAVNRCARIRGIGHGGQTLVSESTETLVREALPDGAQLRDLGVHRLRDLTQPERVFQLLAPDLPARFPPLTSLNSRLHDLPTHRSALIGREREIDEIQALVLRPDVGLVTLIGPGGTGKTRLATQVAAEMIDQFEDGACFVALAPIRDPALVAATIGQALSVPMDGNRPPLEAVKSYLRDREILLVLDNLEQVLDAAPQFVELLAVAERLKLLVTSRVALRVSDEHEYAVPPLELPDQAQSERGIDRVLGLSQYAAVRLFVERSRAVRADFALSGANAADVAELCRRLDGLPLAIELAAARARLLPPSAMLARLAGPTGTPSLSLLTGGPRDQPARLQTIRNTIAWSYDLLEPDEQILFRRLAIFVGGCTLDAIEGVGSWIPSSQGRGCHAITLGTRRPVPGTLDLVESLLAQSLLRRVEGPDGEPRFTMLETIREYGLESLALTGELEALRRWHAEYFLSLAETAELGMRGADQAAWLLRLQADQDNLRAALEWGLGSNGDADVALRICGALAWPWYNPGSHDGPHPQESRRWFAEALSRGTTPSLGRVKALAGAGRFAHMQQESEVARPLIEESLTLARQIGDRWWIAWGLHMLGRISYFDGDAETATSLGLESLALAREIGDEWLVAWAVQLLALAAYIGGDVQAARRYFDESLVIRQRLDYREGISLIHSLLGTVEYHDGNYELSRNHLIESLDIQREVNAGFVVGNTLANLAALAITLGEPEMGARISGAVSALAESVSIHPIPIVRVIYTPAIAQARAALGDERFNAEQAVGRRMSLDEAIAEARAIDVTSARPTQASSGSRARTRARLPDGLTVREGDVLRLIAAGATSQEIANALTITVNTVETHITHVYQKIGARGRAEATAYALRHGLA
jgi:predicted ATPase/class 3 adenylate cyclase/DNA-binding CsgD family transcriptional regulator